MFGGQVDSGSATHLLIGSERRCRYPFAYGHPQLAPTRVPTSRFTRIRFD
jgi:hypothetical protein